VLATNDPRFPGVAGLLTDAAVAVRKGKIAWAGPSERLPQGLDPLPRLDCEGRSVIPGFVDAHVHLLHAGDGSDDFTLRQVGIDDAEISRRGGGIRAVRESGRLLDDAAKNDVVSARLARMLEHGTTTAEAAAGFSDDPMDEARWRRIGASLHRTQPIDLVVTADIADLPLRASERERALRRVVSAIHDQEIGDAGTIRVHVGKDHLSFDEAHLISRAADQAGYRIRLHLGRVGDADVTGLAQLRPMAVDHAGLLGPGSLGALVEVGAAVVLTPGADLAGRDRPVEGRQIWSSGATLAIGTDGSPTTMALESMQMAVALAVLVNGFTVEQALWAATRGGALAFGIDDRGWIGHGAQADMVILDAPSPGHLAYRPGTNLAWKVFKSGALVAR
jgi:imidazolonepropionase